MARFNPFGLQWRRLKKNRCRTCRTDNGKRVCPALSGVLICPACCQAKRAKIPGCDERCRYYMPLIRASKILPPPEYPVYKCLISNSKNTGMLSVIVARERPDGNLKAMFLLLDLWKRGIRDCFVDANLPKARLDRYCEKLGKSYDFADRLPENEVEAEGNSVEMPHHTIVVEAEAAMQIDDGVNIIEMDGASDGKAIDSATGARAVHEINIPKAGKWYVWIRAFFPERSKDSYWIGLDDAEPHPWDSAGGPGAIKIYAEQGDSDSQTDSAWGVWYWDSGVKIESFPNAFFDVKKRGKHRLWSKGREPGSILDQILLTMDEKFNPEEASDGATIPVPATAYPFEPIRFDECQALIRYALDMATEIKTEIPWEFDYWRSIVGDLSNVPAMAGSLYKCPKCGEDLPEPAVDLMREHAQSDDIQFYILCRKCGGEFD